MWWLHAPKTFHRVRKDGFSYTVVPRLPPSQYPTTKNVSRRYFTTTCTQHRRRSSRTIHCNSNIIISFPTSSVARPYCRHYLGIRPDQCSPVADAASQRAFLSPRFSGTCHIDGHGTVPVHRRHTDIAEASVAAAVKMDATVGHRPATTRRRPNTGDGLGQQQLVCGCQRRRDDGRQKEPLLIVVGRNASC